MALQTWQTIWQLVILLGIITSGVGAFGSWLVSEKISAANEEQNAKKIEFEVSKEKAFRTAIGGFISAGNSLRQRLFNRDWTSQDTEVKKWEQGIVKYLSDERPHLVSYFQSNASPNAIVYANTSPAQTGAIKNLDHKIKQLEKILVQ